MSRPADRLRAENARCKQDLRAQLLDIVRHLEKPSVQLVDYSGHVTNGLAALPRPDGHCKCEVLDGKREYVLAINTYDASKNALIQLAITTDLTGD
jgi:hypothetical protein